MHDKDKESYNYDLKIATEYLHNYVIPAFAERLTKKCVSLAPAYVSITREMHSFGINMRYLGRVYNILLGYFFSPFGFDIFFLFLFLFLFLIISINFFHSQEKF